MDILSSFWSIGAHVLQETAEKNQIVYARMVHNRGHYDRKEEKPLPPEYGLVLLILLFDLNGIAKACSKCCL